MTGWLVTGISHRDLGFVPGCPCDIFVADGLTLSQIFLLLLQFFPCIIIQFMLCTLYLSVTNVT